jgi:hypothetical protein
MASGRASAPNGSPIVTPPWSPPAAATAGFSAFSSQRLRGHVWALCRPVIGAGGLARPLGWRDGKPAEQRSDADARHLADLTRWWKERDRAARDGRGKVRG